MHEIEDEDRDAVVNDRRRRLQEVPPVDAVAMLQETRVAVTRLLLRNLKNQEIENRVCVWYDGLVKRLRDHDNTELLIEALGNPIKDAADQAAGFDSPASPRQNALSG